MKETERVKAGRQASASAAGDAADSFVPAPKDTVLPTIDNFVLNHFDHRSVIELARGSLRFEALSRATPEQFTAIFRDVLKHGARLDDLVDKMVIDMHTDKMRR